MCKKVVLASVFAAVVLFVWGMVSWMVLPWHNSHLLSFTNEHAVVKMIKEYAPTSGMYLIPHFDEAHTASQTPGEMQHENHTVASKEPMLFMSVYLPGMGDSMTQNMIIGFLTQLAAAFFVSVMLALAKQPSFFKRVGFVMLFAVAAAIIATVPNWNWWHFSCGYTLVTFADLIIGWYFAALVLAYFLKPDVTMSPR